MTIPIVTVNESVTTPPAPSTLQRSGAIISQGGTNTSSGTLSLITQPADLTPLMPSPIAVSSMTWSGGTVTVTGSTLGYAVGEVHYFSIAGVTPVGYNGVYACTITGSNTFTFALANNPGSVTVQGTYQAYEVFLAVQEYFAQGSSNSVYVLELGVNTASAGVSALNTWITANPGVIYSYRVPECWDANSSFLTFLGLFTSLTAKTYFFITTTTGNYSNYAALKCAFCLVQSPTAPATEFSIVAPWWVTLSYNPSSSQLVTPLAFSYVYDVTAYPSAGNASTLTNFKTNGVNYIGTGAEGGLSNTIVFWGTTMDVNPFTYWYSIDWLQINADLFLSNAVINGSNNPAAPLYYNQAGINTLQNVLVTLCNNGISYGLILGNVISTQLSQAAFANAYDTGAFVGNVAVNAVPFSIYTAQNPSNYKNGLYGGFSVVFTPQLGFEQIIVNINATEVL